MDSSLTFTADGPRKYELKTAITDCGPNYNYLKITTVKTAVTS